MYCSKLFEGLEKRLTEKKNIDQIAQELCPEVSKKREKIIRLIKAEKGGQYLIDNQDWLKYSAGNIRNHNMGNATPRPVEEHIQDNRLNKPSLKTLQPTREECKKWIVDLETIINFLETMAGEFEGKTVARHIWKLNALRKRTMELKMILQHKKTD